jgi:hypothetical protein
MVKRVSKTYVSWHCGVCDMRYDKKTDAIRCEKRKSVKITVAQCKKWDVGDFAIVKYAEDDIYHLVRIVAEKSDGHDLIPVLEFLDGKRATYSHWTYDALEIITDDIAEKLAEWVELIRGATS